MVKLEQHVGRMHRHGAVALVAGLASLLAAPVQAQPGTVYWTSWLRVGPGDGYAVVDEVAPRSTVEVLGCKDGWCRVTASRATGYLKEAMLSAPDIHAGPPQAPLPGPCVTVARNSASSVGEATRICSK